MGVRSYQVLETTPHSLLFGLKPTQTQTFVQSIANRVSNSVPSTRPNIEKGNKTRRQLRKSTDDTMSFHNFSFGSFTFDDEKWIGSPQEQDDDTFMMDSSIFNVFSVIDDQVPLAVDTDSLSAPSVDNAASNFLFADLPSHQGDYHQQPSKVPNNAAATVGPTAP